MRGTKDLKSLKKYEGFLETESKLPKHYDVISGIDSDIAFDTSDRYEMAVIRSDGVVTLLIANNTNSYKNYIKIKRILDDSDINIDSIYHTEFNVLSHIYSNIFDDKQVVSKSDNLTRFEAIINAAIDENAANISILCIPGEFARITFEVHKQNVQFRTLEASLFISLLSSYYNNIDESEKNPANFSASGISDASSNYRYKSNGKTRNFKLRYHQCPAYNGGFDITIRINEVGVNIQSLPRLGYDDSALRFFDQLSRFDEGIILWSGSTSSGKTTSNASLTKLISDNSKQTKKIVTYEDPVEIVIPGSHPSSVYSDKSSFTDQEELWSRHMESAMRRAPHVLYIGEIRMSHVAKSCLRMALSGHLTMSTIHAYDPFQAVNLLQSQYDVNLSTLLMPRVLRAIIAQKLVPVICPECSVSIKDSKETINDYSLKELNNYFNDDIDDLRVSSFKDNCQTCKGRGRIGLQPIYEIFKPCQTTTNLLLQHRYIEAKNRWESMDSNDGFTGITFQKRAKYLVRDNQLCALYALDKVLTQ